MACGHAPDYLALHSHDLPYGRDIPVPGTAERAHGFRDRGRGCDQMKTTCIGVLLLVAAAALVVLSPSVIAEEDGCQVKISGTLAVEAEAVFCNGTGETAVQITDRIISATMAPGTYTLSVRSQDGTVYNEREVVLGSMATYRFFSTKLCAGNADWRYGTDYTSDIVMNNGRVSFAPTSVDETGVFFIAQVGDVVDVTVVPSMDTVAKGFCPIHKTMTLSSVKSVYKYIIPAADDFVLTVPSGADVSLGMKAFDTKTPFEIAPFTVVDDGENTVYTYRLIVGYTYGFRVSYDGFADRCCVLMMKAGLKAQFTKESMESLSCDESGDGDHGSGMLLNINAEGFLRMQAGESFEIEPQRMSFDDDTSYDMFLSPRFHYSAILPDGTASDAVTFDGNVMTAVNDGTAFVLVTYEAVDASFLNIYGAENKVLYAGTGAWTGVFVVTVGSGAGPDMNVELELEDVSNRISGSHLDSDLDIAYYTEEVGHASVFIDTAFDGLSCVYNPVYSDGMLVSFEKADTTTVNKCRAEVKNGPNVICASTDSGTSYQIVKASPIKMSIVDLDRGSLDTYVRGDEIQVTITEQGVPASSQFYGADAKLCLMMFGNKYYSDEDWTFDPITIPEDAAGEMIHMNLKVVCSGECPEFGSHRTGPDGVVVETRSADFGFFTLKKYVLSECYTVYLDTMSEDDWDSSYEADAGTQGKTVDIGCLEVVAGKKMYLTLNRTSTQSMYGTKTITGTDDWLTCDTLSSTTDKVFLIAEPGTEDIGDHRFTIVVNLLNNRGTMKTTVTGTISVLETRTVETMTCIVGKSISLPGLPEGAPVPEGKEFKSWNTEPDGTGTGYVPGKRMTPRSDLRLYAQYGSLDVGSTFLHEGLYYTVNVIDGEKGSVTVSGCLDSFGQDLTVPESVEYGGITYSVDSIGQKAFYANNTIRTADLTAVDSIGFKAFSYSLELRSLRLSGAIGAYSFYCCYNLTNLEIIGDSDIKKSAFSECKNLSDVTFPDNLTVGKSAFYRCTFKSDDGTKLSYDELAGHRFTGTNGILKMYLSEINEVFEYEGLQYKVVSKDEAALIGCSDTLIESLIVPDYVRYLGFDYKVKQIGTKAFYKCTALTSVDLGNVTKIGMKAFANCTSLESIDLSGVATIGAYSFYCCSSLKSLEIADGTDIGASAFFKCKGLEKITFGTISSMGSNAFYGWVFWDSEAGKRMTANAEKLSGCSFEKSASKMILV